jgi:hypothetical protein
MKFRISTTCEPSSFPSRCSPPTASTVSVQAADAVTVDPKIAAYAVTSSVSGKLTSRVPTP